MTSIYALKGRFQALLRPAVHALHRLGATANSVTLVAAAGSLVVAALVGWRGPEQPLWFALLPAWMFVRMALNAIDGMLARECGQQSPLGAYLNELCDVVADTALYLALLAVPGLAAWPVLAFVLAGLLVEYAGVLGPMVGASRRYEGPMGKSDRAFVVGVLGLLLACGATGAGGVQAVLAIGSVLGAWTLVRRVRAGLDEAARRSSLP